MEVESGRELAEIAGNVLNGIRMVQDLQVDPATLAERAAQLCHELTSENRSTAEARLVALLACEAQSQLQALRKKDGIPLTDEKENEMAMLAKRMVALEDSEAAESADQLVAENILLADSVQKDLSLLLAAASHQPGRMSGTVVFTETRTRSRSSTPEDDPETPPPRPPPLLPPQKVDKVAELEAKVASWSALAEDMFLEMERLSKRCAASRRRENELLAELEVRRRGAGSEGVMNPVFFMDKSPGSEGEVSNESKATEDNVTEAELTNLRFQVNFLQGIVDEELPAKAQEVADLERENQELQEQLAALQTEHGDAQAQKTALVKQFQDSEKQFADLIAHLEGEINKKVQEVEEAHRVASDLMASWEADRAKFEAEVTRLEADVSKAKDENIQLQEQVMNLKEDITKKAQRVQKADLEDLKQVADLKEELERVIQKLKEKNQEVEELGKYVREVESALRADLEKVLSELQKSVCQVAAKEEELVTEREGAKEQLLALDSVRAKLAECEKAFDEALEAKQCAEALSQTLQQQVLDQSAKLSQLEQTLSEQDQKLSEYYLSTAADEERAAWQEDQLNKQIAELERTVNEKVKEVEEAKDLAREVLSGWEEDQKKLEAMQIESKKGKAQVLELNDVIQNLKEKQEDDQTRVRDLEDQLLNQEKAFQKELEASKRRAESAASVLQAQLEAVGLLRQKVKDSEEKLQERLVSARRDWEEEHENAIRRAKEAMENKLKVHLRSARTEFEADQTLMLEEAGRSAHEEAAREAKDQWEQKLTKAEQMLHKAKQHWALERQHLVESAEKELKALEDARQARAASLACQLAEAREQLEMLTQQGAEVQRQLAEAEALLSQQQAEAERQLADQRAVMTKQQTEAERQLAELQELCENLKELLSQQQAEAERQLAEQRALLSQQQSAAERQLADERSRSETLLSQQRSEAERQLAELQELCESLKEVLSLQQAEAERQLADERERFGRQLARAEAEGQAARETLMERLSQQQAEAMLQAVEEATDTAGRKARAESAKQWQTRLDKVIEDSKAAMTRAQKQWASEHQELQRQADEEKKTSEAAMQHQLYDLQVRFEEERKGMLTSASQDQAGASAQLEEERSRAAAELAELKQKQSAELAQAKQEHDAELADSERKYTAELALVKEDLQQKHSAELAQAEQENSAELAELKRKHGAELAQAKQKQSAELARAKQELDEEISAELAELKQKHSAELAQAKQKQSAELAEAKQELKQLDRKYSAELAQAKQEHESAISKLTEKHSAELAEAKRRHDANLKDLKDKASAELAEAKQQLVTLKAELEEQRERYCAELADAVSSALSEAEKEHKEEVNRFLQEAEDRVRISKPQEDSIEGEVQKLCQELQTVRFKLLKALCSDSLESQKKWYESSTTDTENRFRRVQKAPRSSLAEKVLLEALSLLKGNCALWKQLEDSHRQQVSASHESSQQSLERIVEQHPELRSVLADVSSESEVSPRKRRRQVATVRRKIADELRVAREKVKQSQENAKEMSADLARALELLHAAEKQMLMSAEPSQGADRWQSPGADRWQSRCEEIERECEKQMKAAADTCLLLEAQMSALEARVSEREGQVAALQSKWEKLLNLAAQDIAAFVVQQVGHTNAECCRLRETAARQLEELEVFRSSSADVSKGHRHSSVQCSLPSAPPQQPETATRVRHLEDRCCTLTARSELLSGQLEAALRERADVAAQLGKREVAMNALTRHIKLLARENAEVHAALQEREAALARLQKVQSPQLTSSRGGGHQVLTSTCLGKDTSSKAQVGVVKGRYAAERDAPTKGPATRLNAS